MHYIMMKGSSDGFITEVYSNTRKNISYECKVLFVAAVGPQPVSRRREPGLSHSLACGVENVWRRINTRHGVSGGVLR